MSSNSDISSEKELRRIPGSYGLPLLGPILDRYDYFYIKGKEKFFISRIIKYNSTVFRTNMPPGPFVASDSRVVAVLDDLSFSILFDTSKVEKRDVFTGTYMPSTTFTGGYRVLSYLDPSEPKHDVLKRFFISLLTSKKDQVLSLLRAHLSDMHLKLEDEVSSEGKTYFNSISDNELFNYVFRLYTGKDPTQTRLGSLAPKLFELWVLPQVAPIGSLGLPWWALPVNLIEDFFLHTMPFPAWTLKRVHNWLYDAVYSAAKEELDEAERLGLTREEACNNLLFVLGFNTYGGVKIVIPSLMKWVGLAGEGLHKKLADEIRTVVKDEGGVTFGALDKMTLAKSVVWEVLRIEPPVEFQYGRAKVDTVVHSHQSAFLIKKGEMIFGYQPLATKDPLIFENPHEFVADRFTGVGERLLDYVYWSNGRETEKSTPGDKQCPGKDLVILMMRTTLVEFFLRYDTFTVQLGKPTLGPSVTITSLVKASRY